MPIFSYEEKRFIIQNVENSLFHDGNSIEEEQIWKKLSQETNRDWQEIKKAYLQWKEGELDDVTDQKEKEKITDLATATSDVGSENTEKYILTEELPMENLEGDVFEKELYVNFNGELVDIVDINYYGDFPMDDPTALNSISCNNQDIAKTVKRSLDLTDFDTELIRVFELQSEEQLEMRRAEHENKMKIYKMHLEQGEELHKEKMKIFQAKLKVIEQQVHHIDHIICNRRLKRFKSGPI